jgi:hypothetical protein
MTTNNLTKSLKNDQNEKLFFNKIDKYIHREIGHKLITITVIDQSMKYVERVYSNNKKIYPLLGQKTMPKNIWSKKVIKNKNHFLCKNKNQIKKIYFDYNTIFSLNCGSIINLLILFKNKPIGTINILHKENYYTQNDIKKIDHLTIYMIPFCLMHQLKMKNRLK